MGAAAVIDRSAYSMRVRPVSRRKTSSSVRPADEDRLGPEAALVDGRDGRLAVVGVEQDPVGEVLDALGDAVELPVERLRDARLRSAAR